MTSKNETLWEEDEEPKPDYDDDADVIKLEIGETIEGIVTDIWESKKFVGRNCYKIKPLDDDREKILLGTTVLDSAMKSKVVGDEVKIIRKDDVPSDKFNPTQIYRTFHKKE